MLRSSTARPGVELLVAATGGHLEQLHRLSARLSPVMAHREWVTFDDPQSRSLLSGERVHYVPYVSPRDYRAVLSNTLLARTILDRRRISRVVSTGSGVALAFLPLARLRGIPVHYIESSARADGPSLTGSLMSRVPAASLYTQYPAWADASWSYRGSLLDSYEARPTAAVGEKARRVVVTLGTMRTYGFRRALESLVRLLPDVVAPDAEILWQVGATNADGLGLDGREHVPAHELHAAMAAADLVISHAGVGSALMALDLGKCPVLLPRLGVYDEHVDDHQLMIARELDQRGLAVSRDPLVLTTFDLREAMATSVVRGASPAPFLLKGAAEGALPSAAAGV